VHPGEKALSLRITIPEELCKEMKKHQEVNWSSITSKAFERQLKILELLEKMAELGITDEEAVGYRI